MTTKKKKIKKIKKEVFVQDKIIVMDKGSTRKPPTITIALVFPSYLQDSQKDADEMIDRLIKQSLGGDIILAGLSLKWSINHDNN